MTISFMCFVLSIKILGKVNFILFVTLELCLSCQLNNAPTIVHKRPVSQLDILILRWILPPHILISPNVQISTKQNPIARYQSSIFGTFLPIYIRITSQSLELKCAVASVPQKYCRCHCWPPGNLMVLLPAPVNHD